MTRILFFGRLSDLAGRERSMDLGELRTVADLRRALAESDPALAERLYSPGVRVAVDQNIVGEDFPLQGAAEIAFMPPMSGG
jgi:molybdopterin converting factor subunit 1